MAGRVGGTLLCEGVERLLRGGRVIEWPAVADRIDACPIFETDKCQICYEDAVKFLGLKDFKVDLK